MSFAKLTCFGVGDGWPCGDRGHSSFLYDIGGTSWLVDCGESLSRSYKRSGRSYDQVDKLLLSHLHCDHVGGFFMFMQGLWLERRRKPLDVHLPTVGIDPVRNMLNACCIFEELHSFKLAYHALNAEQTVQCGGVRVTPFFTTHLESLKRAFQDKYTQSFEAFSFLLESDSVRIAHSADIGAPEDLNPLLARPVDMLVCELAHFEPDLLFTYLKRHQIGRIVFIHLAREYWDNLGEIQMRARRMLPGVQVDFARDGDQFEV